MQYSGKGQYTLSSLNFTQGIQWVNLCSIILIIQGAIDHSILENCSGTKYHKTLCK